MFAPESKLRKLSAPCQKVKTNPSLDIGPIEKRKLLKYARSILNSRSLILGAICSMDHPAKDGTPKDGFYHDFWFFAKDGIL
jgi:hypothetical protein